MNAPLSSCLKTNKSLSLLGLFCNNNFYVQKIKLLLGRIGQVCLVFFRSQLGFCIESVPAISIIGDSHSRHTYYYLLYLLNRLNANMPFKLMENWRADKFRFYWAGYMRDMTTGFQNEINELKRILHNKTTPKKSVIMMSSAHWDISRKNSVGFLQQLPKLATLVSDVINEGKVRVLWWAAPPFPNRMTDRNTYIIQAVNKVAIYWLKAAGAEVIDSVSMMQSVNEFNVCGNHYLCVTPSDKNVTGEFGQVLADILFAKMCYRAHAV